MRDEAFFSPLLKTVEVCQEIGNKKVIILILFLTLFKSGPEKCGLNNLLLL